MIKKFQINFSLVQKHIHVDKKNMKFKKYLRFKNKFMGFYKIFVDLKTYSTAQKMFKGSLSYITDPEKRKGEKEKRRRK